ncbi:hypothetical protein [Microbacterium oxydans]|uniref:hypothetical protein n=1 Tax=Microbacterium oxydans TaxID=82380 RepID=UPI0024AE42C4|nr:hypothetical protein [Microbacterium oxydans]
MSIRATITVDDDRWAKRAFGVDFDDPECDRQFGAMSLTSRASAEKRIESARAAGFEISEVGERHY